MADAQGQDGHQARQGRSVADMSFFAFLGGKFSSGPRCGYVKTVGQPRGELVTTCPAI